MSARKPPPPVLDEHRRAYFVVRVDVIEPEFCSYCSVLAERRVRATHVVVLEGWVSFLGAAGRLCACKVHAEQIRRALIAELKPAGRSR